jgi:hypothetical protein
MVTMLLLQSTWNSGHGTTDLICQCQHSVKSCAVRLAECEEKAEFRHGRSPVIDMCQDRHAHFVSRGQL